MQEQNKAYLQLHAAIFFWGFTGVLGTEISVTAPALVWYRMFFTTLFIGATIFILKKWQKIEKKDFRRLILIGFLFAIHWLAFYISIKMAGASIAMVCLATASIFTAILHPIILKGKMKLVEISVGMIAVFGVAIMYIFQDEKDLMNVSKSPESLRIGIILGVFAAVLSAIFTILNKPLSEKYEFRNIVFYEMLFGTICLSIMAPFYLPHVALDDLIPKGMDYVWLFCLVYFCTVLGQQLVIQALQKLNPFTVTLSVNIEPIYGVILAFLIHNENQFLGAGFYWGVFLIFISLMIQVWHTRRMKKLNALIPIS